MELLINADDFGLNKSCTDAICVAFEKHLITDTTMVANGEAFDDAVCYIKKYHLQNRIGIHFNLTEGRPLTKAISQSPSFVMNGQFHGHIDRTRPLSKTEKKAVYTELTAQINKMELAGIKISHADSHHHIHTGIFIAPIFTKVCKEFGVKKVRLHRNIGSISVFKKTVKFLYNIWLRNNGFILTKYFGSMEDVNYAGIKDKLEIMVHPEFDKNGALIDKVGEKDGFPIGKKLSLPIGDYCMRGYKDL